MGVAFEGLSVWIYFINKTLPGIILTGFAESTALISKHFTGLLLLRKAIAVVIVIVLYL